LEKQTKTKDDQKHSVKLDDARIIFSLPTILLAQPIKTQGS
jgi:hypothetical protein